MKIRILATLMLLGAAGSGHAAPILIDFGTAAGNPTLGGTWNSTQTLNTPVALVDANGDATSITLTISGDTNNSTTSNNTWSGGNKDWVDAAATSDYVWEGDGTITVTLGGLDDNLVYDISLVAVRATAGSRVGTYLVQGNPTSDEVSSTSYDAKTAWDNRNILNWSSVAPSSGSISVTATSDSGHTVWMNAMQVTAIPEPGTLALTGLALGALGLSRLRRRRG